MVVDLAKINQQSITATFSTHTPEIIIARSKPIRDVINIKHVTPGLMEKHTDGVVELHVEVEHYQEKIKKAKSYVAWSLSFYALTLWLGIMGKIPEPFTTPATDFAIASVSISVALFLMRKNKSEE